jgi:predicted DNA repair protein MutK
VRDAATSLFATLKRGVGRFLLWGAPKLMKFLSVAGTAAMFLVGGHILVHNTPFIHHFVVDTAAAGGAFLQAVGPTLGDLIVGIAAGIVALLLVSLVKAVFFKKKPAAS